MTLDLSAAFGEAASSRLRGLLPSRSDPATGADPGPSSGPRAGTGSAAHRTDPSHTDAPDAAPVHPEAPRQERARPSARAARPARAVPTENRRWGMARVASREHVDLLVLSALVPGPESASGIIARLREGSDGALQAPERTVHTTLHRLTRNRLLHRVAAGPRGGPRYALTPAGQRAAESRARRWRTFARAVDGVIAQNGID